MHLQELAPLAAAQPSFDHLNRVLLGLRWRLGFERLALYALRGATGSCLALIGLACAIWLTSLDAIWLWLSAAPVLAACAYASVRWPTRREVAIVVDRRFGLEERLATAVELAEARGSSRFAALQLRDASARATDLPRSWLTFDAHARREGLVALAALLLMAATLVLMPRLPKPEASTPSQAETTAADLALPPDELAQRALPLEAADQALPTAASARAASPSADLAAKVQQEQAERSALDTLAQSLSNVSAGQPAADAIQRGDYDAARDQLQNLADNADQLTEAAKKQLAAGLQQAAARTADTDKALADREQQAAQALARSVYSEQRQALRALGDQVQRSGGRSATADQLERDLGQLQQQTAGSTSAAGAAQPGEGQSGTATQSAASAQSGGAQGLGAAFSGQSGNGDGQQSGAGVGNGSDPNLYADQPSRLDTTGQRVQVPLKLGSGQAVRPVDGSEDQAAPQPGLGTRSTAELSQTQQTGQVAPEQNLVPGEQRPVVRGYFR